ncbi:MAG: hypothetical protein EBY80_09395 [Actinobacteria bacterium]|nr:hypothetical protein [Actinomycetota bacterium]
MFIVCRSVKGGSGTSIVTAALASLASTSSNTVLVDLAGDQPAIFGSVTPIAGVTDWMNAPHAESPFDTDISIDDQLHIVPTGQRPLPHRDAPSWNALVERLVESSARSTIIVDLGTHDAPTSLIEAADRVLLVVRPCYLALRKAVALSVKADSVVVVDEDQRALRPRDVESVLGLPVVAIVKTHPSVARRVDAGLFHRRLPDSLAEPLRHVLTATSPSNS